MPPSQILMTTPPVSGMEHFRDPIAQVGLVILIKRAITLHVPRIRARHRIRTSQSKSGSLPDEEAGKAHDVSLKKNLVRIREQHLRKGLEND